MRGLHAAAGGEPAPALKRAAVAIALTAASDGETRRYC